MKPATPIILCAFSALLFLMVSDVYCDQPASTRLPEHDINLFVDAHSPSDAVPLIIKGESRVDDFRLIFSDEFNDEDIDTTKWNVEERFVRDRGDFKLYADREQVEEKEGNIYIYYRKDPMRKDAYLAGRIQSKGKYAPTYGFLECRMTIVKPDGHQTAFWMMPEGRGMKVPDGVDGTANDGAEIDIIEGNKKYTFSCGLHWDGYGADHRANGKNIKARGIYDGDYHVYGFEWDPNFLRWYVDGKVVRELKNPKLIPHVPHFIYFSGSCFGDNDWVHGDIRYNDLIQDGGVDEAYIDYVRVYKKQSSGDVR